MRLCDTDSLGQWQSLHDDVRAALLRGRRACISRQLLRLLLSFTDHSCSPTRPLLFINHYELHDGACYCDFWIDRDEHFNNDDDLD